VLPFELRPSPSRRLILATVRAERLGLALHLGTGLLLALAEGVTLALVFLAIRQLAGAPSPSWWSRLPLPPLPPTGVFLTLLAAARRKSRCHGRRLSLAGLARAVCRPLQPVEQSAHTRSSCPPPLSP
jgi:hypothetical protein